MIPKGLTMDVRFLRDEAARFRGMAAETDRDATRLRLLAMAADYESRAADATATGTNIIENVAPPAAETDDVPSPAADISGTLSLKPARKARETVVVARRPVGRPRRE
jgi:hypothetical protein